MLPKLPALLQDEVVVDAGMPDALGDQRHRTENAPLVRQLAPAAVVAVAAAALLAADEDEVSSGDAAQREHWSETNWTPPQPQPEDAVLASEEDIRAHFCLFFKTVHSEKFIRKERE